MTGSAFNDQCISARAYTRVDSQNIDQVEERMDDYLEAYDAVILGDGGFDFALDILADFAATS